MKTQRLLSVLISLLLATYAFANNKVDSLQTLAREQGFFFFYSSSCAHCQHFAPTLKRFSQRYGFSVVAVSVDGGFLPSFPDAVMNEGQASVFQVSVFPSLFLVNPKSQLANLVSEGNIDEAELTRRVLTISQQQSEGRSI